MGSDCQEAREDNFPHFRAERRIERRGRCEVTSSCATIVVTSARPQSSDVRIGVSVIPFLDVKTLGSTLNTHNGGTDRNSTKHRTGTDGGGS